MGTNYDTNAQLGIGYIGISQEPCHPTNILWTDEPWKGRVLYTGPDGNCDHRVTVEPEHRYVGIGTMSEEGTSETDYLWRPAPSTPFHRPRTSKVGEIGWCVPNNQDWTPANTARQIMLGQFRQQVEDRHGHRFQNAWYPGPQDGRSRSAMPASRGSRLERESTSTETSSAKPGQRTEHYLNK
ncbi:protein SPMIP2-like [Ruditapes philippinarum]|uniref:protein SPMIP2-like n=1 Tax=Ruditapes philippinarum TaxID=129788 RepID=UPI00295BD78E|nr:protein SPMIP2-like [Ruditapes philippinarum]